MKEHKFTTPAYRRLTVLRAAKKQLARNRVEYIRRDSTRYNICGALGAAKLRGYASEAHDLQRWVMSLLHPYTYYSGWLRDARGIDVNDFDADYTKCVDQLQRSRHAWIDWMTRVTEEEASS